MQNEQILRHESQDLKLLKTKARFLVDERNGNVYVNSGMIYKRPELMPYFTDNPARDISKEGKALNKAYFLGNGYNLDEKLEEMAKEKAKEILESMDQKEAVKLVEKSEKSEARGRKPKGSKEGIASIIESARAALTRGNIVSVVDNLEEK